MPDNPSVQNAVEALNNGADAYLVKPLDTGKVLSAAEEQLLKQKEEREIAMQHFERGSLRDELTR